MNQIPLLFAGMAIVLGALCTIVLYAPRRRRVKVGALALAGCALAISYVAYSDLLSRPKPVGLEVVFRGAEEAKIIAAQIEEGRAIYLWLALSQANEPRAYELPYNQETAKALRKALEEAEENGTGARMRLPFEPSLDSRDSPQFYAPPQPQLPLKPLPPGNATPFEFDSPGEAI